ncbi:zinc-dependent peptidase [Pseudomarimonas salicorniae]|uniref:Zinc-dependent peptidase n=1 Tax=Pseudomarimonas salicorniae TaxID=2933270 RepID=A0ABT0GDL4_9GAMM|nr:M90 family metallopeptidase [Lysobacter sp. CAU 1642]MCK7592244.1 zinc-dependent peptidase [Lysobacter sp. CAU 1642]
MILRWLGLAPPPSEPIADPLWRRAVRRAWLIRWLAPADQAILRQRCERFLACKAITPAGGFEMSPLRRVLVAALCCRSTLRLPEDCLDGWHEVIVYPGQFRVRRHETGEHDGVVHEWDDDLAGEAWERGPIVLSWADVLADLRQPEPGFNVIIHEIAHKLDALDGPMNGTPPLRDAATRRSWVSAFQAAFDDLNARLDRDEETPIDPYAAESPDEFFAVASEYHFTADRQLAACYPEVAALLEAFYGPAPRRPAPG